MPRTKTQNPKGLRGNNPFFYYAWVGDTELFELFFKEAEDRNPRGGNDWTPLHGAACNGHLDIIKKLVESPLIDDKRPLTTDDKTPLWMAREGGSWSPNRQAIIDLLEPFEP